MSSMNAADTATGRPWSLAGRLTVWYAVSSFLLVVLVSGVLYLDLEWRLDREDDQILAEKIRILRFMLQERAGDRRALEQEIEWEHGAGPNATMLLRILDAGNQVLIETPGMAESLPPENFPPPTEETGTLYGTSVRSRQGQIFRVVAAWAQGNPKGGPHILQVALNRNNEEELLAGYRKHLFLVLALALVVCGVLGHQIARHGLRPISQVAATARRIRSTTLNERIAAQHLPAELAELAGTFNEMLDRLEESFARLSRFSADIAHELRTPLNNLRGEAEVALGRSRSTEEYREVLGSCLEEYSRLGRLIDNLLFLARAESPESSIQREPLDLRKELSTVRSFYEALAVEGGVELLLEVPEGIVVEVDRTLFQRAIGNLVANALSHTPSGGRVTLHGEALANRIQISVRDTGSGIAPEHLPHVFDRFYRADAARTSTGGRVGLGLAIVRSIVGLHRGRVEIDSTPGRGTTIRLIFPATASQRATVPA